VTSLDPRPLSLLENVFAFKLGPKIGLFLRPPLFEILTSPNPISNLVDPINDNQASPFRFIFFNFDIINFTCFLLHNIFCLTYLALYYWFVKSSLVTLHLTIVSNFITITFSLCSSVISSAKIISNSILEVLSSPYLWKYSITGLESGLRGSRS